MTLFHLRLLISHCVVFYTCIHCILAYKFDLYILITACLWKFMWKCDLDLQGKGQGVNTIKSQYFAKCLLAYPHYQPQVTKM